jgi:hypothetical protein
VADRNEYWAKLGEQTHWRLQVRPKLAAGINYGEY